MPESLTPVVIALLVGLVIGDGLSVAAGPGRGQARGGDGWGNGGDLMEGSAVEIPKSVQLDIAHLGELRQQVADYEQYPERDSHGRLRQILRMDIAHLEKMTQEWREKPTTSVDRWAQSHPKCARCEAPDLTEIEAEITIRLTGFPLCTECAREWGNSLTDEEALRAFMR